MRYVVFDGLHGLFVPTTGNAGGYRKIASWLPIMILSTAPSRSEETPPRLCSEDQAQVLSRKREGPPVLVHHRNNDHPQAWPKLSSYPPPAPVILLALSKALWKFLHDTGHPQVKNTKPDQVKWNRMDPHTLKKMQNALSKVLLISEDEFDNKKKPATLTADQAIFLSSEDAAEAGIDDSTPAKVEAEKKKDVGGDGGDKPRGLSPGAVGRGPGPQVAGTLVYVSGPKGVKSDSVVLGKDGLLLKGKAGGVKLPPLGGEAGVVPTVVGDWNLAMNPQDGGWKPVGRRELPLSGGQRGY